MTCIYKRKKLARPKKLRKPIISVTVVSITAPESAGSIPIRFRINGIEIPEMAVASKFNIMAKASIRAMPISSNQ